MEKDSLNTLFQALCSPDNKCRRESEIFVQNMINEGKIEFIERILYELINSTPPANQICYSFIIIKKYLPFYNDYHKVIQTSIKYFGNENEQVRAFAATAFCSYSIKSLRDFNDESPLNLLISMINPSSNFNTLFSCFQSIATLMKSIPNTTELYTKLCNYVFNTFLQCESIQILNLLIFVINEITPYISDTYISDERVIQKLFLLIQNIQMKQHVYMLLETIVDYFYSTNIFANLILSIMQISCSDLARIEDANTILRIISFWTKIAEIELNKDDDEVIYHYTDTCSSQITAFLLQFLLKKIGCIENQVDEKTDWNPSKAARKLIKRFSQNSPKLIIPILLKFISESSDVETNFFIVSILMKTVSNSEEMRNQIPNFLNTIYSQMKSPNVRIRYALLCALDSFVSLPYLSPELFQPFVSEFQNEWTDVEQNASKSFVIFAKIGAKMPPENQVECIVQVVQNINKIPLQYVSHFLNAVERYNIDSICESQNENLIFRLFHFFYELLVNLIDKVRSYSLIDSIISILNTLVLNEVSLDSVFSQFLAVLVKCFTEYSIPQIPLTISYLCAYNQESASPHLAPIIHMFVSLLEGSSDLEIELKAALVSALTMIICVNGASNFLNEVFLCMKKCLVTNEKDNVVIMELLFAFFQEFLMFSQIDQETITLLFNLIHYYFTLPDAEIHSLNVESPAFLVQLIDFMIDLVKSCPQCLSQECLQTLSTVINSIMSLDHKTVEMKNKAVELSSIMRQCFSQQNE